MKNIAFLLILPLIYSCNNSSEPKEKTKNQNEKVITIDYTDKRFFDFDKATHYKYALSRSEFDAIVDSKKRKKLGQILDGLLYDSTCFPILESQYFIKNSISTSKLEALNDIFTFRNAEEKEITTLSGCRPVFRDILILSKNSKTVGIANVCFSCSIKYLRTTGASVPTSSFGKSGEFGKLAKLLNKTE